MADPDESLLGEYEEYLRGDFDVFTAHSGLACVDRLCEKTPDVLVLEPQLPWGGGDGVLALMHEALDLAIVPVMILTSCSDELILDNISRLPIGDFHSKPLSPSRLARELHMLLYHHSLARDFAEQNRRLESLITKETDGRIYRVRVETIEGRIIVHGRCGTYHARKLVLAIVMADLETSQRDSEMVELDIQVCSHQ